MCTELLLCSVHNILIPCFARQPLHSPPRQTPLTLICGKVAYLLPSVCNPPIKTPVSP